MAGEGQDRRPARRLETWVTVVLAAVLAALVAWRLGWLDRLGAIDRPAEAPAPRRAAPEDPVTLFALWRGAEGAEFRSYVFPAEQIAARGAAGALFDTISELPGTPFATRAFRVLRFQDEAEVRAEAQAGALEGGNRCLLVADAPSIAAFGGPLTAVITVRSRVPEGTPCG